MALKLSPLKFSGLDIIPELSQFLNYTTSNYNFVHLGKCNLLYHLRTGFAGIHCDNNQGVPAFKSWWDCGFKGQITAFPLLRTLLTLTHYLALFNSFVS